MPLLTRYVLREICQVFLITLTALTLLMVLIGAVREAIGQGLGAAQIVQLFPYLLPNALMFAVPGTVLFSVASVYGRMSATNEITALKSLGLSPMVLLWPALALAVVLSLATVWLNDLAMSWGFHGVRQVVVNAAEDIAYGMLRTHHSFSSPGLSVNVKRVEGRKLVNPVFTLQDKGGTVTVRAESAELHSNAGSGVLTVEVYNGTADAPGYHVEFPNQKYQRDLVIDPHAGKSDTSPAHLALREIPERTAKQHEIIRDLEEGMVAQAGLDMLTGDFDLHGSSWAADADNLQFQKYQLYRMQTEPPRRWANGFSCLCFALVGASMSIRMKNSDVLTSFFLCFGPILLVYYPALLFGVDRSKAGAIHPYSVWAANIILVLWGWWLLRRVIRY